ncbi:endonuclease-reverse transcriptase [Elysia marginata]|uniref:Endonuclease-reverse transcriptase n=1 Tax=Elysia marginata TaxID=1093978 RepID=A0AAV4HQK4_9GAST|nr:endonuclease-reverse transcriptase [Elysia marginata]
MWCYRRVLRRSWKEHKTNEEVLQAADVTERLLDHLVLCYAGHVIRECSGHLLQPAVEGRRGRGCPSKRSWTGHIKQWTHIVHMEKKKRKTENREEL